MTAKGSAIVAAVCGVALWVVAVISVSAYYVPGSGVHYGHPIDWRHLLSVVPLVGVREIGMALTPWWDAAFWISLLTWGALLRGSPSRVRLWLAALTPAALLFPINALGGVAAIFDWLVYASDGETLAEHWPIMHSYAVWTVLGAVPPLLMYRSVRTRPAVND